LSYSWGLVVTLYLFFTKNWFLEIIIGLQLFGHVGDVLAQKNTLDGNMHKKDENDGVWFDGEQDGERRVVVSRLRSL
jgi:hypothetical protein